MALEQVKLESRGNGILDVVGNGLCVGCGACAVLSDKRIDVALNDAGQWQANLSSATASDLSNASTVCPFSSDSATEDEVADRVFSPEMPRDSYVGAYSRIFAGRVNDDAYLVGSSSGGVTSWLCRRLIETGAVDGVVHVRGGDGDEALFGYGVSETVDELHQNRKSQYFAVTFAEALRKIRGNGRTYALVGLPCFIKAARGLSSQDAVLRQQLRFYVGLVCGHLKSTRFAEALAWQAGIPPQDLTGVDFRVKDPMRSANRYAFAAWSSRSGRHSVAESSTLVGANWGHAMFQLKACDYCDDIFAETADVVLGDAWIPRYLSDWRGTNVIVSRSREIDAVLSAGKDAGEISLDPLGLAELIASQMGNVRHRRDGLSVRLADDIAHGSWIPRKRVPAATRRKVSRSRIKLVRQRRRISKASHMAFQLARQATDIDLFLELMGPEISSYTAAEQRAHHPRAWPIIRLARLALPPRMEGGLKRTWIRMSGLLRRA